MPLWTTRSSIWRALSASYAFCAPRSPTQIWLMPKVAKPLPRPARAPLATLDARIAARVAREQANGTYDYVEPMAKPLKRAAVKRNGGLRGSKATCWR